jgi:hypothetical protein
MKSRDRLTKQEARRPKKEKKLPRQDIRGHKGLGKEETEAEVRERIKRSGVEAVKLHLVTSGHTGRTSRSATSVSNDNYYICI